MLRFMASCDERRQKEYEATSWWEYIGADSRSAAYRKFLAEGLTRSLVADLPEARFADRGEHELKGLSGKHQLWEVLWRT
jgi:hypothetical protein